MKLRDLPVSLVFQSLVLFTLSVAPLQAARFADWDESRLTLDNGMVRRTLSFGGTEGGFFTSSLKVPGAETDFLRENSAEFSFEIDGEAYSGRSGWQVVAIRQVDDEYQGSGVTVSLRGVKGRTPDLGLELTYLLYPDLPVIRKKIAVLNPGRLECRLEALDVEKLELSWSDTHAWVMRNFARQKWLGPYVGDWNDPLVIVHDIRGGKGLALGNEAPGITKRTSVFTGGRSASVGLTHPGQERAFRKWLKPGEKWESPWVFLVPYHGTVDPWTVLNGPVNDFVRRHMGIRLQKIKEKPVFVYNTWNPFRKEVSEGLVRELAGAAAECGVEEFIIDDGWQSGKGDWEIDRRKFPGGLKPVFDYIDSLGMKPGLWISLAEADVSSRVYLEHPEWFVRDRAGEITSIHTDSKGTATACLGTGWYGHIKSVILDLVQNHGLAYVKLDLSIVVSSYLYQTGRSGCWATDHPLHRDREESFLVNYRRCLDLFDDLHREAPELFIDCTFETWGPLQQIDYALVKHAEGDWLSNVEEPVPGGSLRVRNLAWWRSPAVPAAALVIGNQTLDDPGRKLSLLSLAGSLPIMLGDPRKVPPEERLELREWADWLRRMQARHGYMLYRQDLPGFGEPLEGQWDGWARINTDTRAGGIIGVFRQSGNEDARLVSVRGLDRGREYVVLKGPSGAEITRLSGAALEDRGFMVRLAEKYDAALFEICLAD